MILRLLETLMELYGYALVMNRIQSEVIMRAKKTVMSVGGICIAIIGILAGFLLDSDEIAEIRETFSVVYGGSMPGLLSSLGEFDEESVVAIHIDTDGVEIRHKDFDLMGDAVFTGDTGDILVVYKFGDRWIEIGRRLVE